MPSATSVTAASSGTRSTDGMLGLTPSEIRLLLLANVCMNKDSGKIDFDKLALRFNAASGSNVISASAHRGYNKALQKLIKLNQEPEQGADTEFNPFEITSSPPAPSSPSSPGPVRIRGRGRGRGCGRGAGRPRGRGKVQTSELTKTAEVEGSESPRVPKLPDFNMEDAYDRLRVAGLESLEG
ncbi:Uncharacterized protein PECH_006193 [Penicillium ucsense]|uniref:Chromatin target of PRMT1 protein C-terminal domain-containing protein n=1 Tax=Penicillium ucsense TaxID=2839758 RepID=A0A8J8W1T1_9EURO|nr:Uncharacterized protein PECM_006517 [Penicillium ucsense]KAF7735726.1 Uncharacterized protein PECH_006193 [Penicillium ucsense]